MKYKLVDDLNILELIDLLSIGLIAYDFLNHVASDVGTDQNSYLVAVPKLKNISTILIHGQRTIFQNLFKEN